MATNSLATSLYGTVKKIGSSQFTFDKYYNNRQEMEAAIAGNNTDGVYHGRYVLVTYGDRHSISNQVANTNTTITVGSKSYTMMLSAGWLANYNIDLQAYNNVYDNTVWQKIFEGNHEKYIMVASLNARSPGLTINKNYYSFSLVSGVETYYTKPSLTSTSVTERTNVKAEYPNPVWDETYSNDLVYHLDMPLPLRLHLNNIEYFKNGFSATTHFNYTPVADENVIRWEYVANPYPKITDADFKFNMPILGQAVSDVYDALYGVPLLKDENENLILDENGNPQATTGTRPFADEARGSLKEETWTALGQTEYKGLFYILSHIGLRGEHYYLSSDWGADKNTFGHIDNKPHVISNITVAETGTIGLWTIAAASQND